MDIDKYTLTNWSEQLERDWQYLRQDNGSGNVERIIDRLLNKQIKQIKGGGQHE